MGPLEVIEKQFNDVYKRRKHQSKIVVGFHRSTIPIRRGNKSVDAAGYCVYNEKDSIFHIGLDIGDTTFMEVCESYIHELCHVLVHPYVGHGKKFKQRFKIMGMRFARYIANQYLCGDIMGIAVSLDKSMTIKGK